MMVILKLDFPSVLIISIYSFVIHTTNTESLCDLVDGIERGGKCYYFTSNKVYHIYNPEKCMDRILSVLPVGSISIEYPGLVDTLNSSQLVSIFNDLKSTSHENDKVYHAFLGYRWNGGNIVDSNNITVDEDRYEDLDYEQFKRTQCSYVSPTAKINWIGCSMKSATLCTCNVTHTTLTENMTDFGYFVDKLYGNSYIMTEKISTQNKGYKVCQDFNCTILTLKSITDLSIIQRVFNEAPPGSSGFDKAFIGYSGNKEHIISTDGSLIDDDVMTYLNDSIGNCFKVQSRFVTTTSCNSDKYGLCVVDNIILPDEEHSTTVPTSSNEINSSPTTVDDNNSQISTAASHILQPVCYCHCYDDVENRTVTERIEIRRQDLTIAKSELSRYKREKYCAKNEQKSSTFIGAIAILIIVSIVLVIFVSDAIVIFQYFSQRK